MSVMAPMEVGSVLQFLENKCIMVTGATGFLAKIFLEKVLRVQPGVKKLYLLLRAPDVNSATQRFNNEIIGKDLFKILKEKHGQNLNAMISDKIALVPGDISSDDHLGVEDSNLMDEMLNELDVIINLAATTTFNERYDVSLGINTLGAKHVLIFAKKCTKLRVLVHVSTAYVSGEKQGVIVETPYSMGATLNGASGLDIEAELTVVKETLDQLCAHGAPPEAVALAMKDLGIKRAQMYGWPNTYVFTKAMAEMIMGDMRGDLPMVTLRPSIITSTYKEPFPGWIEGIRTLDTVVVGYGQGKITCFLGDLKTVIDVIPADMVVNAILVAMVGQAENGSDEVIYQVGSSARNPIIIAKLSDSAFEYFSKKPWINRDGKPVRVSRFKMLGSLPSFRRYMSLRYILPLKGLGLVNVALCKSFQRRYSDLNRKVNFLMRLAELYRPYLLFNGIFDDTSTETLRVAAGEGGAETGVFYFDPTCIDWEDYFMNVHFPGLVKYVFK